MRFLVKKVPLFYTGHLDNNDRQYPFPGMEVLFFSPCRKIHRSEIVLHTNGPCTQVMYLLEKMVETSCPEYALLKL